MNERKKQRAKEKKWRKYSCNSSGDKHIIKKKNRATGEIGQSDDYDRQNIPHIIDLFMNRTNKNRHRYTQEEHIEIHQHT